MGILATIKPVLDLDRTAGGAGFGLGSIDVHLPAKSFASGYQARGGQGPAVAFPLATKAAAAAIALAASTPLDIDLTALSASLFVGDLSLAKVLLLDVRSLEAPGSGRLLTLGGSGGSTEWYAPFGQATGKTLDVPPGTVRQVFTLETAGYAVGTRKILRLDPGGSPHSLQLFLVGA